MKIREYINFLNRIEKLKCNTRHSWTSTGRHESVAEHCFRSAIMAMLVEDEFENADISKVIKMCLVHDFGEAVLGDIPAFLKTEQDEIDEEQATKELLGDLPEFYKNDILALFEEMKEMNTLESKIFKAIDNMEALVSHNESDISTWLPNEYTDNLTYGAENVKFSAWMSELKEELKKDSLIKIEESSKKIIQ